MGCHSDVRAAVNPIEAGRTIISRLVAPLVKLLAKTKVTPNTLSWIGLLIALVAAAAVARGYFLIGGLLVLFGGGFDLLDGSLARLTQRVSRFGALLDSTLDRLSEAARL